MSSSLSTEDILKLRGDRGTPTHEELKRDRMRDTLFQAPVKITKAKKGSARSEDYTEAALDLAREYDQMRLSKVQLKIGAVALTFEARVWEDRTAGTLLLCLHSSALQVDTGASGEIFDLAVDGREYKALFLGVRASLGLRHTLVPVKVADASQDRTSTEHANGEG
jgi:hypothetical protein